MEGMDLSTRYQRKSDKEHILDNPDTYTGTMEHTTQEAFVYDAASTSVVFKEITMIPGLFKLFDEACVNCRDHVVRCAAAIANGSIVDRPVTNISIDVTESQITLENDGTGIDIAMHPEHDVWIPEMIFAHLRTSTNYDKKEKRIVGGKNGFGFKLVLVWSKWGQIETVDASRKLKYTQVYRDNLDIIEEPTIAKCSRKPYTKVSFCPDFARLGMSGFTPDLLSLFHRRVLDIAAVTSKSVRVTYNGVVSPIRQLSQYADLYIGSKSDCARVHESPNDRWEYVVALAPAQEFTQVSFVNGIHTAKGGKHVDYVINQIVRGLTAIIKKKKKVDVRPSSIKEQLCIILRCDIENPSFDSQTKDHLTTAVARFGSTCDVSEKFIEKIGKLGVIDAACAITEVKATKAVKRQETGQRRVLRGVPKLVDANLAGTVRSGECTLILCEGDSAKAGIISGLSRDDRDKMGVYPLKGKLFNTRGESSARIAENKEIFEIKKSLGLEAGLEYSQKDVGTKLRYGSVLFMTDQDPDGSHIKGLAINLFDSHWPSLASIPGFLGCMNTPILKARRGTREIAFYNMQEYQDWRHDNENGRGWSIKYYKGLGTSTGKEFKEYFADRKVMKFCSSGAECRDSIDLVFNKKRAGDRKEWLSRYCPEVRLDVSADTVSYENFVSQEMIHFSKYDCDRSIPSLVDGLKTSLRKILFTAFKRNLTKEIKVAQFSGSVSELSGYHHGEASLNGGIVHMAQNFVGAGNVNLLEPNGQFGTRLEGGLDSASERYICTKLSPVARLLFPAEDDAVLDYLDDDGQMVEPQFYAPIAPLILMNGCKGIGTGFSTNIPCYNPLDVVAYLKSKLGICADQPPTLVPWYRGFRGSVVASGSQRYTVKGVWERVNSTTIRVTELPVGLWTSSFKSHVDHLACDKTREAVRDYTDHSTERDVEFTITFAPGYLDSQSDSDLEKFLKLTTTISTTNMHVFDESDRLRRLGSPEEIVEAFIPARMRVYEARHADLLERLERRMRLLSDKARFIQLVIDDQLELRGRLKDDIIANLRELGFQPIDDSYAHLVRMPIDMLSLEERQKLEAEHDECAKELDSWKKTTVLDLWDRDLNTFTQHYSSSLAGAAQPKLVKKKLKKAKVSGKAACLDESR